MRLIPHVLAAALLASAAGAQQPPTAAKPKVDYHKADLIRTSSNFVLGTQVQATWLDDSTRFFYRSASAADRGTYYLVDPVRKTRRVFFDHARIASALSIMADTVLDPAKLSISKFVDGDKVMQIAIRKTTYDCDVTTYVCSLSDTTKLADKREKDWAKTGPSWASRSKDKKWDVFQYNYNLYLRPAALADSEHIAERDSVAKAYRDSVEAAKDTTKKAKPAAKPAAPKNDSVPLPKGSIQLTTDGIQLWEYGNEVRAVPKETPKPKPAKASIGWAPDSKKFNILRYDVRGVRIYPLYSSTKDQPVDKSYYFAAPGDSILPRYDIYIFDVESRTNLKVKDVPNPAVVHGMSGTGGVKWGRTSDELYVLNSTRGSHRVKLSLVNTKTGEPKMVTRDSNSTFVEMSSGGGGAIWDIVNGGEDILWWSERDGWGHLYRFAKDGTLKNQITRGTYVVGGVSRVDSVAKQIYFTTYGKDPGVPYYAHLYRVNFDGTNMIPLTPEDGNHSIHFSPHGDTFIDTYSRTDLPPVTTLRALDGKPIMELSRGDVSLLRSVGWTPADVFTVKARDGQTDIWGLMYKPSNFDSTKSYPIITHIYPGPQQGSVGDWGFTTGTSGNARALAELGFIVIQLDHMGTPKRAKWFHDFYYGNMGDNGLPDHIAAIRQLAAKYAWIDINRVGIFGHSGGGFASTDAILRYPDFFKVAVSGAGNHDNRTYGYFWGEKYQGLVKKQGGKDNYEASANYTLAGNLKGKLLIMHGDVDDNVHPANALRVVDALVKANKDFDMIIFPDAGHGFPEPYATRKQWDYFVRWLLGAEPPEGYQMIGGH